MEKKARIVTPEHWRGLNEYYGPWIECPACGKSMPAREVNYCLKCGVRLVISPKVQEWIKK